MFSGGDQGSNLRALRGRHGTFPVNYAPIRDNHVYFRASFVPLRGNRASKEVCLFGVTNRIGFDANPLFQQRSGIHRMGVDVDLQQLLCANRLCLAGRVSHGQTSLAIE